jgi:hypothetical protein
MIFVQPAALDLNQQMSGERIAEKQIGTSSVYYDLPTNETESGLNE